MQISPWLAWFLYLYRSNNGLPSHGNTVRVQRHNTGSKSGPAASNTHRTSSKMPVLCPCPLPVKKANNVFSLQGAGELELRDVEAYE